MSSKHVEKEKKAMIQIEKIFDVKKVGLSFIFLEKKKSGEKIIICCWIRANLIQLNAYETLKIIFR